MFNIKALPLSDFRDLIILLQRHEAEYDRLFAPSQTLCSENGRNRIAVDSNLLQRQTQEIEASYGWVLASDSALVLRMFETEDEGTVKTWMRELIDRYEERKESLRKLARELEKGRRP